MKYGDKHMIHTDIYRPSPAKACERCIFGSGQHEPWCSEGWDTGGYVTSDESAIIHQDYVIPRAMAEEIKRIVDANPPGTFST